ncbi:protein takeout-like [Cochliomyia hominivorax]
MNTQILTVLVITIGLKVNGEFPDDPKPCKYGDTECIKTIMNHLFKDKVKGDDSLNFPALTPLKVDKVRLQQGEESPVSIDLVLSDCDMYGFATAKTLKVKGFNKDLTKKNSILLQLDYLTILSDYAIDGKILILPIKGNGRSNITLVAPEISYTFTGRNIEKDGGNYMHIDKYQAEFKNLKRMYFKVDNLFNGDKALGDNMNLFLNENWKDIYDETKGSLNKAYADVFTDIVNKVFSKYPFEKYFIE